MKQTYNYSASQYVSDNGFPLSWMCRCCLGTNHATSGIREEAEEHHERSKSRPGTIIGRPAGREAYHGRSAMLYQQQSRRKTEQSIKDDKVPDEATSET